MNRFPYIIYLFFVFPLCSVVSQQKSCPVRIVSAHLLSGHHQEKVPVGGVGIAVRKPIMKLLYFTIPFQTNIWRQFSTDKNSIYNQQQRESTVEMPGPNNSAVIYRFFLGNFQYKFTFSEQYEPDSESSLTANFKVNFKKI